MTTTRTAHRRLGASLAVCVLVIAGCGGDDDDTTSDAAQQSSSDDDQSGEDSDGGGSDGTDSDNTESALDVFIAGVDEYAEATTDDGGRLLVGVDCDPLTGGNLISAASGGLPEGIYSGEIDPPAGGKLTLQVFATGEGIGARQTTLDELAYTVTFADLGLSVTIPGCSGS